MPFSKSLQSSKWAITIYTPCFDRIDFVVIPSYTAFVWFRLCFRKSNILRKVWFFQKFGIILNNLNKSGRPLVLQADVSCSLYFWPTMWRFIVGAFIHFWSWSEGVFKRKGCLLEALRCTTSLKFFSYSAYPYCYFSIALPSEKSILILTEG